MLMMIMTGRGWEGNNEITKNNKNIFVTILESFNDFNNSDNSGTNTVLMGGYGHLVLELILLLLVMYLLLQKSSKTMAPGGMSYYNSGGKNNNAQEPLTEEEVDELCREWKPEPLVPPRASTTQERILSGPPSAYTIADGKRVLNLVSTNFLGISGSASASAACSAAIDKYGVGSAGPRGFYGTIDVHLQLERRLAGFFNVDEAILYSFGLATMTSLIPAYAKRGDIIVVDAGVNYALQSGIILSRSTVRYFKHNDVKHLEQIMREYTTSSEKNSSSSTRRPKSKQTKQKLRRMFVVVEGVYQNYGDIAALDAIVPLCRKYKFRLMVDESLSVGVLGKHGRGAFEHHNLSIPRDESVIIAASMSNALGSVGGFCVGDKEVIAHQRLGGNGYVFSASLPPFLASAGLNALDLIEQKDSDKDKEKGEDIGEKPSENGFENGHENKIHRKRSWRKNTSIDKTNSLHNDDCGVTPSPLIRCLHENAMVMRDALGKIKTLEVVGEDKISPMIHLRVRSNSNHNAAAESVMLNNVVEHAFKCNILLTMAKYSQLDREMPRPSIRVREFTI